VAVSLADCDAVGAQLPPRKGKAAAPRREPKAMQGFVSATLQGWGTCRRAATDPVDGAALLARCTGEGLTDTRCVPAVLCRRLAERHRPIPKRGFRTGGR
jgi:hypothetical protein